MRKSIGKYKFPFVLPDRQLRGIGINCPYKELILSMDDASG